ncbi:MAG: cytochrome c oxidase assembly protein [Candidatus Fonsibacter sp.]|nr:cytochrome c oxidase assembly protein [Candidatus Fonsibacter ubiquis]GDX34882.1 cytochrome c oxidase assembly protein CtaG [Pelagibacterales bacterium]
MSEKVKNNINPIYLVLIFFIMLGLSYASVPLYELFCKVTGFGGTPKTSKQAPNVVIDHNIVTRFDTNVSKGLFWEFKAEKNKENIKVGQVSTIKFTVKNLGNETSTAVSTFNVVPDSAGKYFNKISCFCFEQQTLKPKESKDFVMAYFIDPKIVEDLSSKEIKDITLSYTFFDVANYKKVNN